MSEVNANSGQNIDCLGYEFTCCYGSSNEKLDDVVQSVFLQMKAAGYQESTLQLWRRISTRLEKLAVGIGTTMYTEELRQNFLDDNHYVRGESHTFSKSRYELHRRFIHFIDSYLQSGTVDFHWAVKVPTYKNPSKDFQAAYNLFSESITTLSASTQEGYLRLTRYFLDYLVQNKGYTKLEELQKGDVAEFIPIVVNEHYHTGLTGVLSGLRAFLQMEEFELPSSLSAEIPLRFPKPQKILDSLENEEIAAVHSVLDNEKSILLRDKAICEIAFGTGYRSIDITGLQFSNIDWENDRMTIVQHKTGKTLNYPLSPSMGNAIVDYLLYERPESDSKYVFLQSSAPHYPLVSHAGIRMILKSILQEANIERCKNIGTRLTRHSRATFLLRKGVPLALIAQSLGHSGINTVHRYLSVDEEHLVECILPMP